MSNIVEPQILSTNQGSFVMKDSKGNIVETKPTSTWFSDYLKNNPNPSRLELLGQSLIQPSVMPNKGEPYVFLKDFSFIYSTSDGSIGSNMVNYKKDQVVYPFTQPLANEKRILEPSFKEALDKGILVPQKIAKQQALMQQEVLGNNNRLTDKVFGKQSNFVSGGGNRFLILPTYVILGAVVGRYVAKNMKKSTTLGMVLGGLAPLLAYQLSIEYDRKNMPKQEPKQKVAIEPTSMPIPNMPQVKPSGLGFNLNCPNGTKKVTVACAVAPCPEMEVCA